MSDTADREGLHLRRAIRKAVAVQNRAARMRAAGLPADVARDRLLRRREDWARRLREGRQSLTTMEAELDHLVRFDDLFSALVLKPKRR